jgi:hypothetical protein
MPPRPHLVSSTTAVSCFVSHGMNRLDGILRWCPPIPILKGHGNSHSCPACRNPLIIAKDRHPLQSRLSYYPASPDQDRDPPQRRGLPCAAPCSKAREAIVFHGGVHTVGSSMVTTYSSVLELVRVQRSVRCKFSRAPRKSLFVLPVAADPNEVGRPSRCCAASFGLTNALEDRDAARCLHGSGGSSRRTQRQIRGVLR